MHTFLICRLCQYDNRMSSKGSTKIEERTMEPQMMWDLFVLFVFLPVAIYVWVTYKRERDQTKLGYRNPDLKLLTCNNPNCDFRGDVKPEIRGSKILGILLLILLIIPGALYLIFWLKKRYVCPSCGTLIRED